MRPIRDIASAPHLPVRTGHCGRWSGRFSEAWISATPQVTLKCRCSLGTDIVRPHLRNAARDVYTMAIRRSTRRVMSQAILKWGNSLAFRIPAAIAKQMEIGEGEEVEFYVDGRRLVVEKAAKIPRFTQQDLLKSLRKMKKGLIDLGSPQGKEIL